MSESIAPIIARLRDFLRREVVQPSLFEHALREHPRECCGMIHESGIVRQCENAIEDWGEAEPPLNRSAKNGYALGFDDLRFLTASFDGPDPIRAIYHSHPDGSTGFSETDRLMAAPGGEPIYPQLCHLVIGCDGCCVTGATLYSFDDGTFRQVDEMGVGPFGSAGFANSSNDGHESSADSP